MTIKNSPIRMTSKHKVAAENSESRSSLTDEQQVLKLDGMFGEGKGAHNERAKLVRRIAARKEK